MKIFIPEVGDKIILEEDWTLKISDFNNDSLIKAFSFDGLSSFSEDLSQSLSVNIPKQTVLLIEKIDSKKEKGSNNIYFKIINPIFKNINKVKFWVNVKELRNLNGIIIYEDIVIKSFKKYLFERGKKLFDKTEDLSEKELKMIYSEILSQSEKIYSFKLEFFANDLLNRYIKKYHPVANAYNSNYKKLKEIEEKYLGVSICIVGRITKKYDSWIYSLSVDNEVIENIKKDFIEKNLMNYPFMFIKEDIYVGKIEDFKGNVLGWADNFSAFLNDEKCDFDKMMKELIKGFK